MPKYKHRKHQIGNWWLTQRSGSPAWYAETWDEAAKRTRRISLGTAELEEAKEKLLEKYLAEVRPVNEPADGVLLADLILDYYNGHGVNLVSASNTQTMCGYWADYFGEDSVAASGLHLRDFGASNGCAMPLRCNSDAVAAFEEHSVNRHTADHNLHQSQAR